MIWSRPELSVLFVCTANVCRSPLAEGLLRHYLSAAGLAKVIQVRSAGTQTLQRGLRPDPRMERLAAEAGISLGGIRSRRLTLKMIRRTDHVLVMERSHLAEVARLANGNELADPCPMHVQLLGRFLSAAHGTLSSEDIPDPYYGDLRAFREVYDLIDAAVSGFVEQIIRRGGSAPRAEEM